MYLTTVTTKDDAAKLAKILYTILPRTSWGRVDVKFVGESIEIYFYDPGLQSGLGAGERMRQSVVTALTNSLMHPRVSTEQLDIGGYTKECGRVSHYGHAWSGGREVPAGTDLYLDEQCTIFLQKLKG